MLIGRDVLSAIAAEVLTPLISCAALVNWLTSKQEISLPLIPLEHCASKTFPIPPDDDETNPLHSDSHPFNHHGLQCKIYIPKELVKKNYG